MAWCAERVQLSVRVAPRPGGPQRADARLAADGSTSTVMVGRSHSLGGSGSGAAPQTTGATPRAYGAVLRRVLAQPAYCRPHEAPSRQAPLARATRSGHRPPFAGDTIRSGTSCGLRNL